MVNFDRVDLTGREPAAICAWPVAQRNPAVAERRIPFLDDQRSVVSVRLLDFVHVSAPELPPAACQRIACFAGEEILAEMRLKGLSGSPPMAAIGSSSHTGPPLPHILLSAPQLQSKEAS